MSTENLSVKGSLTDRCPTSLASKGIELGGVRRSFERHNDFMPCASINLLPAICAVRAAPKAQFVAELFRAFVGAQGKRDGAGDVEISGVGLLKERAGFRG